MEDINPLRDRTFTRLELGRATFEALFDFYKHENPECTEEQFATKYVAPMFRNGNVGAEKIKELIESVTRTNKETDQKYAPLIMTCAYLAEWKAAEEENDENRAWSRIAQAQYWCGVMMAGKGIEDARKLTINATRKKTASNGGAAKAKKYEGSRELAFQLARERKPIPDGWTSRTQATKEILPAVCAFAKNAKAPLSPEQAQKTVYEWLSEMPDAATLFPRKPKESLQKPVN